jgi:putative oxygen-independent coproporphyrinogen III oxidase
MPGALPIGDPPPSTGQLPDKLLKDRVAAPFGIYVHVPFCAVRCGYCDFNTYTPRELSSDLPAHDQQAQYARAAAAELRLAHGVLGNFVRPATTVFFGGGTPNLLPPQLLVSLLEQIQSRFGLTYDAEVTLEANPDAVQPGQLELLREAGFNRISFGMQSAAPAVLKVLDRTHSPASIPVAVDSARAAGFANVSLDLIYGTPGESIADWHTSLQVALAASPDHLSAYSLIIEPGTALARQVTKGALAAPDDDDLAEKYLITDEVLTQHGFAWYEVSNWARSAQHQCQHNLLYWQGADWWGIGPGAHSHFGGIRWWNRKHPHAYAQALTANVSPAHGRETLSEPQQRLEAVMLGLRLVQGLDESSFVSQRQQVADLVRRGWLAHTRTGRVALTQAGRLVADAVVRELVD